MLHYNFAKRTQRPDNTERVAGFCCDVLTTGRIPQHNGTRLRRVLLKINTDENACARARADNACIYSRAHSNHSLPPTFRLSVWPASWFVHVRVVWLVHCALICVAFSGAGSHQLYVVRIVRARLATADRDMLAFRRDTTTTLMHTEQHI